MENGIQFALNELRVFVDSAVPDAREISLKAIGYSEQLAANKLSVEEYNELLDDLKRLCKVQEEVSDEHQLKVLADVFATLVKIGQVVSIL